MLPASWWRTLRAQDRWILAAALVWSVILLVIGTHAAMKPGSPTIFSLWRNSGQAWRDGGNLYNGGRDATRAGFRYGPMFGALFVPLTWIPASVGAVLWRLGNAGVFLASFAWWLRHGAPIRLAARQTGILFTISAILAISNLFTGQLNLLLGALALIAVTAAQRQRWSVAALVVAVSVMMKMYPLALGLLLVVVCPRKMGWRLAVMLLLLGLAPFLFQNRHYVAGQYGEWFGLLSKADSSRRFMPFLVGETYRDLLLLLRLFRVPITLPAYTAVQALCGLGCAAICLAARLRSAPSRLVFFHVLMLGCIWMTLCGPASEPRTYGLLIPPLVWWCMWVHDNGPSLSRFLAPLALGPQLLCALAPVSKVPLDFYHAGGLMPLSALALLGSYLTALPALRTAIEEQAARPSVLDRPSTESRAA